MRTARPAVSVRMPARAVVVFGVLVALIAVAICLTAAFGEFTIGVPAVLNAIFGHGSRVDQLVIDQFRLPRITECVLVGAALGLSGGLFQLLTRNPLAAPDVIGVNEGAAVVAVWLILAGAPVYLVPAGAFGGALAAVAAVGALALRRHLSMFRLLLVGVGINTLGGAVVAYLLTYTSAADFERLNVARQWLLGGVSGATWGNVQLLGLVLLPVTPVVLVLGRQLNAMQLGEDLAVTLGVRVSLIQAVLAGFGALLAAVVVSVAGPIGFVAFIAPHIARRLARTSAAASLPVAMAAGGLLVLLADYAAQRVLAPTELPVGIATTVIGAPYLLYLLIKAERTQGVA